MAAPLDSLKQDTSADTTDTAENTSVAAKAPTSMGKGAYLSALPSATIGGAIPSDLLKTMEQMIAEREKQKNSLNEAMRDATAWWSGGMAGPGEALRLRAAEREGQDATTFGMKSALAQYKAAQQATANRAKSLGNAVSGGTGGAGGTSVGGVPMSTAAANEIQRLLSLEPPDVAGAEEIRRAWAKNETKFDAPRHTQQTYYINPEIGNVNMTPEQWTITQRTGVLPDGRKINIGGGEAAPAPSTSQALPHTKPIEKLSAPAGSPVQATAPSATGVNAFNVGNVRPQGSSTGFQQPKDLDEGLQIMDNNLKAYGDKGINTLEGVISRWSPPSENDTPALIKAASQRLGLDPKQPIDLSNPAVRRAIGTAIMLQEKGPKAIFTGAPAQNVSLPAQKAALMSSKTSTADLPYPSPQNSEEVKANQDFIKRRSEKQLEISSKGPEKAGTEAGTRQAQMFKLNEDADKAIEAANIVIAASKNHPESTGIGKGFTGANLAVTLAGALPKMDKEKAEQEYADFTLSKEAMAARDQIDTASKQLGISFAADVFKGARMGIGLENMAAGAKGVSVRNLAENNFINATLIKEAALFNKERARLFKEEWAPKNGGTMADFEKFETSPEYNALKEQYQKRIVESLPQYLKLTKDGLVQTKAGKEVVEAPKSEPSKFDKYRKPKAD